MVAPSLSDAAYFAALRMRLDTDDAVAMANLAWCAARAGVLDVAQEAARRAAASPDAPPAAWRTLERLALGRSDGLILAAPELSHPRHSAQPPSPLVAAVAAHRQASVAVAEACYHAALMVPELQSAAWNGLAVLHEQRGEASAADEAWAHALQQPEPAAVHNRALAWMRRGERHRGRALLAEHADLVSSSASLLFLVGYAALLDDDPAMARLSVEAAIAIDPDLVRAQFTLGLVSERLGRHEQALAAIRRGLMMSPWFVPLVWLIDNRTGHAPVELADHGSDALAEIASYDVLLVLGRSLLEAGHLGEALGVFDQVLLRDESHTAALFHRGVVLAKLRRYDEALADWEGVLTSASESDLGTVTRRHAGSARKLAALFGNG
ncbi:MAG: tetratricopeptide repeat protein [Gemmatimonadota bacterium]